MNQQKTEDRIQQTEGKTTAALFHLLNSGFWLPASLLCLTTAFTCPALAADTEPAEPDPWRLCSDLRLIADPAPDVVDSGGRILADADSIESAGENVSRLSGDVSILRGTEELFADQALYDSTWQRFELTGNVRYRSPGMELIGERLLSYGAAGTTAGAVEVTNAEFYFPAQHASGNAREIARAGNITTLEHTRYTTCDPADPDWVFHARRITLNHAEGQGYARSMALRFKDVPVFYFPVLSFPIDDRRKSGFLIPGAPSIPTPFGSQTTNTPWTWS
jgi:LPS-assembly protein